MLYLPEGQVAEWAGLPVDELRKLVMKHGSVLGIARKGRNLINLLALYRLQEGLPPEPVTDLELAVLCQRTIDAYRDERSEAPDLLVRVMVEMENLRRLREIGYVLDANSQPGAERAVDPLLEQQKRAHTAANIVKLRSIRNYATTIIKHLNANRPQAAAGAAIVLEGMVGIWLEETAGGHVILSDDAWEALKRTPEHWRRTDPETETKQ